MILDPPAEVMRNAAWPSHLTFTLFNPLSRMFYGPPIEIARFLLEFHSHLLGLTKACLFLGQGQG